MENIEVSCLAFFFGGVKHHLVEGIEAGALVYKVVQEDPGIDHGVALPVDDHGA